MPEHGPHQLMQFFSYAHLPAHLQEVSKPFGLLAAELDERLDPGDQKTLALTLLLQAKDAAVRAKLAK